MFFERRKIVAEESSLIAIVTFFERKLVETLVLKEGELIDCFRHGFVEV